ncbi:MAG: hypothetical protein ABL962_03210, partial [Fimbriimonadaceae bacterium]
GHQLQRHHLAGTLQDTFVHASLIGDLLVGGVDGKLKRLAGPDTVYGMVYKWPPGSFVIRCDQAFRPHILDMFEPQDHPNDFQYPGGPPIPPYDNAGYTLAFQMGVKFDRVLEPVEIKTVKFAGLFDWLYTRSTVPLSLGIPWSQNEAFSYANRGLKEGLNVELTSSGILLSGDSAKLAQLRYEIRPSLDGSFVPRGFSTSPTGKMLSSPRVALWDRYGGSMESGWTRWVLEQFAFDFDVVFPPDLDAGNLNARYDCIIFPDGAIPAPRATGVPPVGASGILPDLGGETGGIVQGGGGQNLADDPTIPLIYRQRIGSITAKTIANLKEFVEKGGHLLCIGSSALNISRQLQLPIESALVDEKGVNLPNTKFYIPGSVLRMKLNRGPLTLGMDDYVDVMYDNSPAFRYSAPKEPAVKGTGQIPENGFYITLDEGPAYPSSFGVQNPTVGFYDSAKPLRSGWAWGQEVLKDTIGVADVPLGKGRVVLYGPEILFRGQSHGTFKLLFNAIFRSAQTK